ncbi:MAG: DEAD/DEAH box helicase family protein [Pirellulaceae bacterium]|nr:DEAD/DEAH box helicase family protein [Pirellulaceae bacterium]
MPSDCPFCATADLPVVFRDDLVFAVWDRYPVSKGHLLIVTNRHVESWFDASQAEQHAMLDAIQRGRRVILDQYSADGFNIGVNIGAAAGQTIPHVHLHLIPRLAGDTPEPQGGVRHVIPGQANHLASRRAGVDLRRDSGVGGHLVRGGDDPLLPHLQNCLDGAAGADFAVAFILRSGVERLREHIRDLLQRGGRLRILTGDYLNSTDPDALTELLDLGGHVDLRVFEVAGSSFHPKAYIFHYRDGTGTAFVGSSNLSSTALGDGVEWNYRVLHTGAGRQFADVAAAFDALFVHPQTRRADPEWIAAYRVRRGDVTPSRLVEVVEEARQPPPEPHAIQQEALAALRATRLAGNQAGLVVLATGLGKTWLAAFDSTGDDFSRILFVAHREEILSQALETFRQIRPLALLGRYTGSEKAADSDVLVASIQTLGQTRHLDQFAPGSFDYIVVDEFHHASARTYRRLIDHFTPRFLLGLTATPERTDGGDLLALCQENLVYRRDILAGIEAGLLCPFQYYGVPDEVDYLNMPWRSTRFDELALTEAVATTRRAENALQQYRLRAGQRTLAFCCSQRHADFMADYFTNAGVRSVAVHSGPNSAPRATALDELAAGRIGVVFAVDMFNEGLDVPTIDTVLMLRPTESSTIWQQQFGRGLRRAEGKARLTMIDYIGNHRTFLIKVRSLLQPLMGARQSDADVLSALHRLEQGQAALPAGCEVTYELEAIDIIKSLLRTRAADDAIVSFYEDFRQRHGGRPTAVELYHSGYRIRSLRKSHGSWLGFVGSMGDLGSGEVQAVGAAGEFIDTLETTPMTRSFKMLTLLAMLNLDALPGGIGIEELTNEFQRIARRSRTLRVDVGESLDDDGRLRSLIIQNPIAALCGGKGTGGFCFFKFDSATLHSEFSVPAECREEFQCLVRELVDWRLAEYLGRSDSSDSSQRFVCKVIHAGGRPILKLPDRRRFADLPRGWVEVRVNDQTLRVKFAKEYVNLVRSQEESGANLLGQIVRDWFGADAGRPGTGFQVAFERAGESWQMEPVRNDAAREGGPV